MKKVVFEITNLVYIADKNRLRSIKKKKGGNEKFENLFTLRK